MNPIYKLPMMINKIKINKMMINKMMITIYFKIQTNFYFKKNI